MANYKTCSPSTQGKLSSSANPSHKRNRLRPSVQVDRNLDRFPLWVPASRPKAEIKPRIITRQTQDKIQKVIINPTAQYGDLTTEDYVTFLGLLKYWDEKERPIGNVSFSVRKLARILKKKWGGKTYEGLTNSLLKLRSTPIEWHHCFINGEAGTAYKSLRPFNLIEDLELARKEEQGRITGESGYFRLNKHILKNLMNDYTKPVLLDTLLKFKSEIAQILYIHLDLMIYGRTRYERCTKELFADIGYTATRYKYLSNRRRKLSEAIEELRGAPLPTGRFKDIQLQPTADKKDLKLVVIKGARQQELPLKEDSHISTEETFFHSTATAKTPEREAAKKLVSFFYKVFHSIEEAEHIPPKAIEQALGLIKEVGYEKAQYLVKRSKELSSKTNFNIQVFGGVLQYKTIALADYDKATKVRPTLAGKRQAVPITEPLPTEEQTSTLSHEELVRQNKKLIASFEKKYGSRKQKTA
ncbi:MAG: hypothetical protein F6J86_32985 [Symploca sp. SIO1B1]|nr:hypothetical protein [Symploca sp. SIO1B1]